MFSNKKISGVLTGLMIFVSGFADAAGVFDTTIYSIGLEVSLLNRTAYSSASTHDINLFKSSPSDSQLSIRKNRPGFAGFVQARFSEYIGLELGYSVILKVTSTGAGGNQSTNKITSPYIDLYGFMPVAARVDLLGAVGAGLMKSDANVMNVTFYNLDSLNKAKVGYRIGGGALFYMTNNWGIRSMLRYQQGNKVFLKSNTSFSIGALYTF